MATLTIEGLKSEIRYSFFKNYPEHRAECKKRIYNYSDDCRRDFFDYIDDLYIDKKITMKEYIEIRSFSKTSYIGSNGNRGYLFIVAERFGYSIYTDRAFGFSFYARIARFVTLEEAINYINN